ncbi:MAG: glycosyltransferase family 2 protein [Paludibacteraceae bacterium]|nr:glycosyltransferase family 2 protein [Paludibacteraceae bacterium]
MSPRVTIIMPIYNVGKYLRESIDSILAQTYRDFELLILDDYSTDDSSEIIATYTDLRIRYICNSSNLGLADNLNKGLNLVHSEFVARMDGDDIAEPNWLQRNIEVLDSHPEIGICSSGFQFFGTRNSLVRYPQSHEDSMVQMLFGCTVIVPVIRMSFLENYHLRYNKDAFPAEDYDLWSRCYPLTKVYNIQETLFHYRMHESQISTSRREFQIQKTYEVRLRMLNLLNPNVSEEDKDYFLGDYGAAHIEGMSDMQKMIAYGEKLEKMNVGTYDSAALHNRLAGQVSAAALSYVIREYWSEGYSLSKYMRYVASGFAKYIPAKYQFKFLVKSIICRAH